MYIFLKLKYPSALYRHVFVHDTVSDRWAFHDPHHRTLSIADLWFCLTLHHFTLSISNNIVIIQDLGLSVHHFFFVVMVRYQATSTITTLTLTQVLEVRPNNDSPSHLKRYIKKQRNHSLQVLSRYRDRPQPQVGKTYIYLFNLRRNMCKSCNVSTHISCLIPVIIKRISVRVTLLGLHACFFQVSIFYLTFLVTSKSRPASYLWHVPEVFENHPGTHHYCRTSWWNLDSQISSEPC